MMAITRRALCFAIIGLTVFSAAKEDEEPRGYCSSAANEQDDECHPQPATSSSTANDHGDVNQQNGRSQDEHRSLWSALAQSFSGSFLHKIGEATGQQQKSWPELPMPPDAAAKQNAMAIALTPNAKQPRALSSTGRSRGRDDESDDLPSPECIYFDSVSLQHDDDDPFVGMMIDVYHYDNDEGTKRFSVSPRVDDATTCDANFVIRYQLMEPLDLKLGSTVKHVAAFAYMTVLADQVEQVVTGELSPTSDTDNDLVVSDLSRQSPPSRTSREWWQWWIPWWSWDGSQDHFPNYRMNKHAFAGGSHGEVWRGCRRWNLPSEGSCNATLIFKRLKVENGYRVLEAGLREVYFGRWLADQVRDVAKRYTGYVDHFYREQNHALELWIVFEDGGSSLRSFLYTGSVYGDYVVYQHSVLWTQLRMSAQSNQSITLTPSFYKRDPSGTYNGVTAQGIGIFFMREVLRQILEAAAFLHSNGIVHRDIKPRCVSYAKTVL